jgi:hypothetical protein
MKKTKVKIKTSFYQNTKKYVKIYFNLILNHCVFNWVYYKHNINLIFFNNKNRSQICLKLICQYDVQTYFFIQTFSEIDMCEIIT